VSIVWRLSSQVRPLFATPEARSVALAAEAAEKRPYGALPIGDPQVNREVALVYSALSYSRAKTALKTLMHEIGLLLVYLSGLVNYYWRLMILAEVFPGRTE
jgi:hypothetical protein